jgi:hypothetical protein
VVPHYQVHFGFFGVGQSTAEYQLTGQYGNLAFGQIGSKISRPRATGDVAGGILYRDQDGGIAKGLGQ